jgi:hypothetical protein
MFERSRSEIMTELRTNNGNDRIESDMGNKKECFCLSQLLLRELCKIITSKDDEIKLLKKKLQDKQQCIDRNVQVMESHRIGD